MNFKFRTNWRGKLILQIFVSWFDDGREMGQWQDATVGDLEEYYATKSYTR